jgi:hypothetical protein
MHGQQNITVKMKLKETVCQGVDCIHLRNFGQDPLRGSCVTFQFPLLKQANFRPAEHLLAFFL